jgi:hypothetical protein
MHRELPRQRSPIELRNPNQLGRPPSDDAFTPYDERHFAIYLSLLHASADGLGEDEMCRTVLGIDPQTPGSNETLRSHLERARWFSTTGYRHLLDC